MEKIIYQVEIVNYDKDFNITCSTVSEFYTNHDEAVKDFESKKEWLDCGYKYNSDFYSGVLLNEFVEVEDLDPQEYEYISCLLEYNYNDFKRESEVD